MKKIIFGMITLLTVSACNKEKSSEGAAQETAQYTKQNGSNPLKINIDKNTVRERFPSPEGYEWIEESPGSFGYFIENFPLKPYGSPILKYDATPISTQHLHEAVFDLDTGSQDLQQCADAVIRLRAEYLFRNKKSDEIRFHFTNGDLATWDDYRKGVRAFVNGNTVHFRKTAPADDSYKNFREYLDLVFNYAGTISLHKETRPVSENSELKTGDILITPGSPGHVVFIAGVCRNTEGEKQYLLGEGFTPVQSVHIIANPFEKRISPWYSLDVNSPRTATARYIFKPTNFRQF